MIYIYIKVVNIVNEDFLLYIDKIQLDDGKIINLPPLHFKKYIYINKYNVILDALNQNTNRKLFNGTVEEYKKNGWQEE